MKLAPQKIRMLKALLAKPHTSRELMVEVGCNNPADIVQHLRKDNDIFILCKMIPSINRDGRNIKIGLYSIPECEREKAQKLLEAAATTSSRVISNLAKQTKNKVNYNTITA